MKIKYFIVVILFAAALQGCQSQPAALTDSQKEAVIKEVSAQFAELASAVRKIDAGAWAQNYSSDGFISAFANADYYASRRDWADTISKFFAARNQQVIDPLEVRVTPLAPDLALMTSRENVAIQLKDGKDLAFRHSFTMIWKKEKDGWRILHSHESIVDQPAR
jgi:uncharacterized protein (TIGR02246 family)